MATPTMQPAWFADPVGSHRLRYWDGREWTVWVADEHDAFRETDDVIKITRRRAWTASLLPFRVLIDDQIAGFVSNGQTRTFSVTPGTHRVRVKQWYCASREFAVSVPPNTELRCGLRGGSLGYFGLSIVQPRRSLALEDEDQRDSSSPFLVAVGLLALIAIYWVGFALIRSIT